MTIIELHELFKNGMLFETFTFPLRAKERRLRLARIIFLNRSNISHEVKEYLLYPDRDYSFAS